MLAKTVFQSMYFRRCYRPLREQVRSYALRAEALSFPCSACSASSGCYRTDNASMNAATMPHTANSCCRRGPAR
ncbi:hypothetical protein CCL10_00045 [Pseudomonas syringae]|nr:hypothetical protein CCL10_00045 [Pseudomonas syringae]